MGMMSVSRGFRTLILWVAVSLVSTASFVGGIPAAKAEKMVFTRIGPRSHPPSPNSLEKVSTLKEKVRGSLEQMSLIGLATGVYSIVLLALGLVIRSERRKLGLPAMDPPGAASTSSARTSGALS